MTRSLEWYSCDPELEVFPLLATERRLAHELGATLPPADEGIVHAFVIPAWNELPRLIRLLSSIVTQTVRKATRSEVLYVVNNTQQECQEQTQAFQQNQVTVRLLQLCTRLKSQQLPSIDELKTLLIEHEIVLNAEQLRSIAAFLRSRVAVHAVDISHGMDTEFEPPLQRGETVAAARNVGGVLAHTRLGPDGYCTFIDADCVLPPNYLEKLYQALDTQKSAYLHPIQLEQLDLPEELLKDRNPLLALAYFYCTSWNAHLWKLTTQGMQYKVGPIPTVRTSVFMLLNGYPLQPGEDVQFSRRLHAAVPREKMGRVAAAMTVSDRRRAESFFGRSNREVILSVRKFTALSSMEQLRAVCRPRPAFLSEIALVDEKLLQPTPLNTQRAEQYAAARTEWFQRLQAEEREQQDTLFHLLQAVIQATRKCNWPAEYQVVLEAEIAQLPRKFRAFFFDNQELVANIARSLWMFDSEPILQEKAVQLLEQRSRSPHTKRYSRPLIFSTEQPDTTSELWAFLEYYLPDMCGPYLVDEPSSLQSLMDDLDRPAQTGARARDIEFARIAQYQFTYPVARPYEHLEAKEIRQRILKQ